jgi:hypothetical protein
MTEQGREGEGERKEGSNRRKRRGGEEREWSKK